MKSTYFRCSSFFNFRSPACFAASIFWSRSFMTEGSILFPGPQNFFVDTASLISFSHQYLSNPDWVKVAYFYTGTNNRNVQIAPCGSLPFRWDMLCKHLVKR